MSRQPFPGRHTIHSDAEDFRGFEPIDVEPWRTGPMINGALATDQSREQVLRKKREPYASN